MKLSSRASDRAPNRRRVAVEQTPSAVAVYAEPGIAESLVARRESTDSRSTGNKRDLRQQWSQ